MTDTTEMDAAERAWVESGRCGDAYHRLLAAWFASSRTNGSAKEILGLGLIYKKALDQYLECVAKLPSGSAVQHNFPHAMAYKSYLESSLEFFSTVTVEKPPQLTR